MSLAQIEGACKNYGTDRWCKTNFSVLRVWWMCATMFELQRGCRTPVIGNIWIETVDVGYPTGGLDGECGSGKNVDGPERRVKYMVY